MQAALRLQHRAVPTSYNRAAKRRPSRRLAVAVRAHGADDDDAVLPIWSGKIAEADPEKIKWHSARLGGKTLGEELELMQAEFTKEEHRLEDDMNKHLYTANWQGDVYVGSRWNILTVIMGLLFFVPVFGLVFAYLSYGTLWTGHYYGI